MNAEGSYYTNVRNLILETAEGVFSKLGFRKTTMNEIARALHRAKSSIYYYFKSKEEIFKSIVEKESESMKEEVTRAIEKERTPVNKLKAFVVTRIDLLKKLSNYYSALKDEYLENFSFIEEIRKTHLKEELKTLKGILSEGMKKGYFAINNLEQTAMTILTALKGLELPIFFEKKQHTALLDIDSLLDILLNGVKKRESSSP